ncbi:MAG: Hsp20/alpha crystallin family protein [Bacteroidota bacterium]
MLFRYEPIVFDDVFARTAPVEWEFPGLFTQFSFVDRASDYPSVNIAEDNNGVQIIAEIPGVPKDDVKLQLHEGTLTISGERKAPAEVKDSALLRGEIRYGSFSRTIQLPENVDAEKVTAEYTNGVLRVTLPKHEASKPKEISIR